VSRKPRKTLSVPSVTISVGSFKVAMKKPLISPSASPIAPATAKATRIESPMPNATIAFVPTYMAKAAIAVNDTSMPPEARTRTTPTANSAVTMLFRNRSNREERERKLGDAQATPRQTAARTTLTKVSLRVRRRRIIVESSACEPVGQVVFFRLRARHLLSHAAGFHDEDAIAGGEQFGDVVGDHDHAHALRREPSDDGVNVGLRSDVDPDCRSVEDQDARGPGQPTRQHHALLIAAREAAGRQAGVRRHDMQTPHPLVDQAAHARARKDSGSVGQPIKVADDEVACDRLRKEKTLGQPVGGNVADAEPDRVERRGDARGASADGYPTLIRRSEAEQRPGQSGPARAEKPGDAKHLSGMQRERYVLKPPVAAELLDPQKLDAWFVGARARVLIEPPAEHKLRKGDHVKARRRPIRDLDAITKDDDALADGEDLGKFVADENHSDAIRFEPAPDVKQ